MLRSVLMAPVWLAAALAPSGDEPLFLALRLRHLLCTDIGRDGAMTGPNVALYREVAKRYPALHVQASGGVSGLADLSELAASGARYAITGKALLEGCFTVAGAREHLA